MIALLLNLIISAQAGSASFFSDLEHFKNKSLSLQSEKQNLEASSDFLLSKQLFWTPKLSISANKTQAKVNSNLTSESDSLQADLTLNLFRGGSDWNSMQEASAQKKTQELEVINESLRVETKASDLIFKSLYLSETYRIQEQLLKLKEESLRIVSDRFQKGQLPRQEVTKTEVDLTQQKNKMRTARLDVIENKSQINSLFISEIQTSNWPFSEKVSPKLNSSEKIPLIEQKYWQSRSREENWNAAKGSHWPSVDFSVQYQESPVKERTNNQWLGVLTFTLPIWNQYETSAQVSSAYAQYMTAMNDFKDTEQILKQKTLFLKEKIETARFNLAEAKKNLEASRKLYQDILKGFRLGRISTNDLFLEQNRLLDSENALALSQLSFHQSLIETCVLAGLRPAECIQEN